MTYQFFAINQPGTDAHVTPFRNESELKAWLRERDNDGEDYEYFTEFPKERDPAYWGAKTLIIRGDVAKVIPPGDWRIE